MNNCIYGSTFATGKSFRSIDQGAVDMHMCRPSWCEEQVPYSQAVSWADDEESIPDHVDAQAWENFKKLMSAPRHRLPSQFHAIYDSLSNTNMPSTLRLQEQFDAAEHMWRSSGFQATELLPEHAHAASTSSPAACDAQPSHFNAIDSTATPPAAVQHKQPIAAAPSSPSKRSRSAQHQYARHQPRSDGKEPNLQYGNLRLAPVREHSEERYNRFGTPKKLRTRKPRKHSSALLHDNGDQPTCVGSDHQGPEHLPRGSDMFATGGGAAHLLTAMASASDGRIMLKAQASCVHTQTAALASCIGGVAHEMCHISRAKRG